MDRVDMEQNRARYLVVEDKTHAIDEIPRDENITPSIRCRFLCSTTPFR